MDSNHKVPDQNQPDYNLHLPGFLTHPLPVVVLSLLLGGLLYLLLRDQPLTAGTVAGICFLCGGLYLGLFTLLKRYTNLERRLQARDKFLEVIPWRGDETLLDVGCGNGIFTMGAARRLTSGKGIGIDIWTDYSGDCRPEAFRKNAELEAVADRVTLENEDVRQLPYAGEYFDIVISGLTMHHLSHGKDTSRALSEMTRVLKPGGWLAIYDVPFSVKQSSRLMRRQGLLIKQKNRNMVFGVKPETVVTS